MHSDRCSEHHVCAGFYVKQVFCASVHTFSYTLAIGCAYAVPAFLAKIWQTMGTAAINAEASQSCRRPELQAIFFGGC